MDRLLRIRAWSGKDASPLRALVADDACELTRVDVGYRHRFSAAEVVLQAALGAPVADRHGEVANDQACGVDLRRLEIRGVGAGVADVGVGQGDDLAEIGGVVEDFLIAGHGGVEDHLAHRLSGNADGAALEDRTILQRQYRCLCHR